jgi:regulatory protein
LRTLGGRALSAGELRRKLEARAEQPEHVRQVLEKLREFGYLDDRKFAEAFSAARLESHGLGSQRVVRDLLRRRVAPGLARETVDRVFSGADEIALIEAYLQRKFRTPRLEVQLADPKKLAAAYRRLRMAGFSAGNSIRVLKRHSGHAEALESLEAAGDEGPEGAPPSD